jgi:3',5'-cyclic AMP phosphodiesterase CpdA
VKKSVIIAQISDLHTGSQYFIPNLMTRTVEELNELEPDAVIITGDITDEGFRQEYTTAHAFLSELKCKNQLFVPGNHDARNVGYIHFEEIFGDRNNVLRFRNVIIVGADSSEPDLDYGHIGRERYSWLEEKFIESDNFFKVFALHHHLLPVPGTGRERNIVNDAGDLLEVLLRSGVDLVLCGHKHVPYVWRLENLVVLNAGTAATLRLRGRTKPCYNVIELEGERVRILRKYPYGKLELIADFSLTERKYCKWEHVETKVASTEFFHSIRGEKV